MKPLTTILLITVIYGTMYAAIQSLYRSTANDPQIAVAQTIVSKLEEGQSFEDVIPTDSYDIAKSGESFVMVYDEQGEPLLSSGYLHDEIPLLPSGVFDFTKQHGEDRISWLPERGVRVALIVRHFSGSGSDIDSGFVAVGRSLFETEKRISQLTYLLLSGWLISMATIFVCLAFGV